MVPSDSGLRSRNLNRATFAFNHNDSQASKAAHAPRKIEEEPHRSNSIKKTTSKVVLCAITSGSSGIIASSIVFIGMLSTFTHNSFLSHDWMMIVAATVIVVLISSGAALGYADGSNKKAEIAFYKAEKQRESWEYDNYLEGEQREMVELYCNKGMNVPDAEVVVSLLSKYRELFVDIMMAEELQLMPVFDHLSPLGIGLTTWLSYISFGTVPLAPLLFSEYWHYHISRQNIMYLSILLSSCGLFLLGFLKSYFVTHNKWWKHAVIHLLNGIVAIGIAAGVGVYLGNNFIPYAP